MNQPLRGQEPTARLRERYRKHRRRQFITLFAGAAVLVAAVFLVLIVIGFLRSCSAGGGKVVSAVNYLRDGDAQRLARQVASPRFEPAPWLLALDDTRLYSASDSTKAEVEYPHFPLDAIEAVSLNTGEPLWRSSATGSASALYVTGESVFTVNQELSDPPRIVLRGYSAEQGLASWELAVDNAEAGTVVTAGKSVYFAYWLADSYRLVCIDGNTGAKAWGVKLKIPAASLQLDMTVGAAPLLLNVKEGIAAFAAGHSIGFVRVRDGKVLRQYNAPGVVERFVLDGTDNTCYLVTEEPETSGHTLSWMPYFDGVPVELLSFAAKPESLLLCAAQGYCAVSYVPAQAQASQGSAAVACLMRSAANPRVDYRFSSGVPVALVPARTGGEFLLALDRRIDESGRPSGWGALHLVSAPAAKVEQVARLRRPVAQLAPFRNDYIVVLAGGEILQCLTDAGQLVRLGRTAYPETECLLSPSGKSLAIISYPRAHSAGQPNQSMQALLFR